MFINRSYAVLFVVAVTFLFSDFARANILEEVTVTAQKREQSSQEVGIAITAMTGAQMEALNYTNAQQVVNMAPGVTMVQPNGEANYAIAIRGVSNSDFTTNVESPVAMYLDEVYISQMSGAGFQLFDMERVEILRGPQGTLYGRNATGGLVSFITRKPTREFEGYGKLTYGDYSQIRFEGAISGGVSDTISGRLAVSTNNHKGYVDNRYTDRTLNNGDDQAARLHVLFEPTDNFEALISARYSKQDIRTGFFEYVSSQLSGILTPGVPNPVLDGYTDDDGDVYAGDYDDPGYNDLKTGGITANLQWNMGEVNGISITDYSKVKRTYIEDSDASPLSFFNFFLTTDAKQFSEELRFDGEADKFRWVGGLYYLDLDMKDTNGAITDPFIGPAPTPGAEGGLNNPYHSQLSSISIFGQAEIPLAESFNLIVGGRVIRDKKKFDYVIAAVEFFNPDQRDWDAPDNVGLLGVIATYNGKRTDTDWAARVALDWTISDEWLTYISWNRGVKGGGYNAPIFPLTVDYTDEVMSYDPEKLDAFEIGFKSTLADGKVRFNGAAYYYDYNDYQAFNIVGIDTLTFNTDATSKGIELELQASPGNWDLILGGAWNDVKVKLPGGVTTRSVQSPEVNLNGLIRYSLPLGDGQLAFQVNGVYLSKHIFALTNLPNVTENGYTVFDGSISYFTNDGKWAFSVYVKNFGGEEYLVQTFDLSTTDLFGLTEQYYGRPRWWGISARYAWGN
jgi:iron complex outermembrane receptor protein